MSERRYSDEEVAEIFQRATETQSRPRHPALAPSDGMTLRELEDIGREAGIEPALVRDAARSLDMAGSSTVRRFLGLPVGVGRTVNLPRRLTDEEWERLVVDLRETFDARGRIRVDGNFRQWTNGNLQALIEPTTEGNRLRLRTMKGNAYAYMLGGLGIGLGGGIASAVRMLSEGGGDPMRVLLIALAGLAVFAVGALQLPSWARERSRQMEEIAARAASVTGPAELSETSERPD